MEKDVEEEITVFEPVPIPLDPNAGSGQYRQVRLEERKITVRRDIYHPELEKSGVITTDGGQLQVTAGEIDNSFGILNAQGGVVLSSSGEVINESGLIRSGGKTVVNGKQLRNGYRKTSQVYDGVNPNHPIMEDGCKFEDHLAKTKYVGNKLPKFFKTFDFFDEKNGIAISAK
ncbi:MAG: hypothetical protein LBE98_00055, partial [Puniceicoccales bacterium]|nr:hypothetical protein [Puniceicoccales bacterium]